jgi:hypothetical protein
MRRAVLAPFLLFGAAGSLPSPANAAGVIGSSNVAPIEPNVAVPAETPCVVTLVTNATFGGDPVNFAYSPPAACPGPWAKVVLSTDVSLNAGRQFDRTAVIYIGGVPVLFGTTAEPRAALAPSWHVERDITDDTAMLKSPQSGYVLMGNYQDSTYTSTITANAKLLFYPATRAYPAPATPDLVVPLNSDPNAGTATLNTAADTLSRTGILPSNVEKARLDVFLQSQSNDEFWYTCVPDAYATALESCGGGAFREGLVSVDGVPAGVAPIYPWIYTGGIDPYLWEPIPGVQTLAFAPTSVDLTPFAGVVDDGKPHTLSVSVAGANQHFAATGTLYLTLDHHATALRGAVTRNTLTAAAPVVTANIVQAGGEASGTIDTRSTHDYSISGYLLTSHGPVVTTVAQHGTFSNRQTLDVTSLIDDQAIVQRTDTLTTVTTSDASGRKTVVTASAYPLDVKYDYVQAADGSATQVTTVRQVLDAGKVSLVDGLPVAASAVIETRTPTDTLSFNSAGAVTGHAGTDKASYLSGDTRTGCLTNRETATNSVLSTMSSTSACDILGETTSLNALTGGK